MQTQCPHCDTRFRITEIQVTTADGIVRCGVCQQVFNAFEVSSQHEHQTSLLDNEAADSTADFSATQQANKSSTDSSSNELDFFSESDSFSKSVVPDKFRDTHHQSSHSFISTLLWSIGILFLTATLMLEHVWYNRDQFKHIPELQAALKTLCGHLDCQKIPVREPAKIELVSRNVYSHPSEKNALIVTVTLKNNADFAQPYPVMQIDFSNIRGGTVAARRFLPADYLPADSNSLALLPPGQDQTVSIEIQDPGKDALTYEFNFL